MKGLILKDLLTFKTTITAMIFLLIFYIILGMYGDSSVMFVTMACVINMMIPLTCAGYDEQCGWDSFGNSLPVGRTRTVIARYLTEFVIMLGTLLIIAVSQIIFVFTNNTIMSLPYYIAIIAVTSLISAIMNPVLYKFGVQKGRFVMIAIFLVPSILTFMGYMFLITSSTEDAFNESLEAFFAALEQIPDMAIALIVLAVCALIYALSMLLSISIYKKKDF